MLKLKLLACAALALGFLATGTANASCLSFEETRSGDAYLTNTCKLDVNAAYAVTSGEFEPGSSALARVLVPGGDRKQLWADGNRPIVGHYNIKVFSCIAPSSLVYPKGGRPLCQIGMLADAG